MHGMRLAKKRTVKDDLLADNKAFAALVYNQDRIFRVINGTIKKFMDDNPVSTKEAEPYLKLLTEIKQVTERHQLGETENVETKNESSEGEAGNGDSGKLRLVQKPDSASAQMDELTAV